MKTASSIFHTTDLIVGYQMDAPLFNNLNVSLEPGRLVCLMGPNGAGKSTLIRTLAGLQSALGGTISQYDQKHVSVVLTDKVSSLHMTAGELITYGRYPHVDWTITLSNNDREVISGVIERVHIAHLVEKKLYELSDGQLQMVMIARALAQETPVLLLDEPTAHLDLNNRLAIMNLLRELAREEQKAILVSTHELDLALQTADMIWLASNGRIKEGIPEDLVLNGSFDEVFQFKGFDLKTGRVQHQSFRSHTIQIEGSGHALLWTKNALERNGFEIVDKGNIRLTVNEKQWSVENRSFSSLKELLGFLINNPS